MIEYWLSGKPMDNAVEVLDGSYAQPANLLCVDGSLAGALQMDERYGERFYPLVFRLDPFSNKPVIENYGYFYRGGDPEYDIIQSFYRGAEDSSVFRGDNTETTRPEPALPYHHLLNLPNTPEDVRFRQLGVRELVENPALFNEFISTWIISKPST